MFDLKPDFAANIEQQLNKCFLKLKSHPEIILFGAGISGRTIINWLLSKNIKPIGFVDNNQIKIGSFINGIEVYSKSVLAEKFCEAFVIISCGDYTIIVDELKTLGVCKDRMMYIDPKWITFPDGLKTFIEQHFAEFQMAYELLADEKSKEVFMNMLKYKISYNPEFIKNICSDGKERYFDSELIDMRKVKYYVDVGGYTGDTIDSFIDKKNKFESDYEKIFVFEPNEINMNELLQNVERKQYYNIIPYQIGLSNQNEVLSFDSSSNIATRIDVHGSNYIVCKRLDQVLENVKVELIKMDIEGAELRALEGCENVIKKYIPILAICVYHKPEDYYEIPLKIKSLCPKYKIFFRQYELSDTETVCYAIGE